MSEHPIFTVEEWSIREMGLHFDTLAQSESIFALSNGHVGLYRSANGANKDTCVNETTCSAAVVTHIQQDAHIAAHQNERNGQSV
jgi:trehalose/maltose hydrolase-like predicted phosphorylase